MSRVESETIRNESKRDIMDKDKARNTDDEQSQGILDLTRSEHTASFAKY